MTHQRFRTILFALGALSLTACAGTAPNAVTKGFPSASLDANKVDNCEQARDVDRCARDRDLNAVDPLEDDGFHDTKVFEAREAERERKRARKGE